MFHATVILAGLLIHRVWSRLRPTPHAHLYSWHLPSVALLFSSVNTVLLLGFVLVWDSRLPLDRRMQQSSGLIPDAWISSVRDASWQPRLATMASAIQEWNTEWLIRNLLGGLSAGVALGTVLPVHPVAGMLVVLLGLMVQAVVRHKVVHLPGSHSATYVLQHGSPASQIAIAAYCQP